MGSQKRRNCKRCGRKSDDLRGICQTCMNGKCFQQTNGGWLGRASWIKQALNLRGPVAE